MNDRAVNLLEQYDLEVFRTRKGRGAILCDTSQGCLIFKEYAGNEERLAAQDRLLTHLQQMKDVQAERIMPTKEGDLYVKDYDGVMYILKTYAEGRECNVNDRAECLDSVKFLAKLHSCMEFEGVQDLPELNGEAEEMKLHIYSSAREYEKRNRELKKVRRYLKQRSQKTWFEIKLQQTFDRFLDQALSVTEEWQEYEKLHRVYGDSPITYCHGDYQYHNLLKTDKGWFVINFEKCILDNSVRDLYLFMRKLLEKSNWNITLGKELLAAYEEQRPLNAISRIDLYYRLAYPEKFWKICNFYYNSGKAWIPGRNLEKLEKLVEQEPEKQKLLDALFRNL